MILLCQVFIIAISDILNVNITVIYVEKVAILPQSTCLGLLCQELSATCLERSRKQDLRGVIRSDMIALAKRTEHSRLYIRFPLVYNS